MTGSDNSCMVCFEEYIDKCALKCSHIFCKRCVLELLRDLKVKLSCPYCRQECTIFEISDGTNGEYIFPKPNTIAGGTYVQGSTVGLASYHFESIVSSYISYESPSCQFWPDLDDGSRPDKKKYFINPNYDASSRIFTGNIDWSPTSWNNNKLWKYRMMFSDDFLTIESGHVECFAKNGEHTETQFFGEHLIYRRMVNINL